MQELIEILEAKILPLHGNIEYINGMNAANNYIIYYIKKKLLEREKEQIINAATFLREQKCRAFEDGFIYDGEEYYNQTYNQNK